MVFGHVGAPGHPWERPWLPDLDPEPSGPLRTLILDDFKSIFDGFWKDFGWIFVTMSCRIVICVLVPPRLGPSHAHTHPHAHTQLIARARWRGWPLASGIIVFDKLMVRGTPDPLTQGSPPLVAGP